MHFTSLCFVNLETFYANTWNRSVSWSNVITGKPRLCAQQSGSTCKGSNYLQSSWPTSVSLWWFSCSSRPFARSSTERDSFVKSSKSSSRRLKYHATKYLKRITLKSALSSSENLLLNSYGADLPTCALISPSITWDAQGATLSTVNIDTNVLWKTCSRWSKPFLSKLYLKKPELRISWINLLQKKPSMTSNKLISSTRGAPKCWGKSRSSWSRSEVKLSNLMIHARL